MLPWFRSFRRRTLPLTEALADAEEELSELYEELDNATGPVDPATISRLEKAEEELEEMNDEIQALREKCRELQAEVEKLRASQTEEAVCAVFLDSSVGRALVARLGKLQAMEEGLLRLTVTRRPDLSDEAWAELQALFPKSGS